MFPLAARRAIALLSLCLLVAVPLLGAEVVFEEDRMPGRVKKLLGSYAERVQIWAFVQRVVDAVRDQNAAPVPADEVRQIDAEWRAGNPPGRLDGELATNDCAAALRSMMAANPGYADVLVVDREGVLVCTIGIAPGYSLADDPVFVGAFNGGEGSLFVGARREEPDLEVEAVRIGVPVRDQGTTVGVLIATRFLTAER